MAHHSSEPDQTGRESSMRVIRKVAPYLWPKSTSMRVRVVTAMLCLVLARVVAVAAPQFYGSAVDALAPDGGDQTVFMLTAGAVGLTIAYGLARLMSVGFNQLRDVIFAKVGQRALRRIALET
ncbi:MAG: metal ABC transporter permease, partial [Pseudomonadota bacterium]